MCLTRLNNVQLRVINRLHLAKKPPPQLVPVRFAEGLMKTKGIEMC